MGVTPPGWYEDEHDPALARWWDGDRWTDHTLVIAEQVPNVQPPPPPGFGQAPGSDAFLDDDEDAGWARLDDDDPYGDGAAAGQDDPAATSVFVPAADAAAPTSVFALEDEAPAFGSAWDVPDHGPLPPQRGPDGLAERLRDLPPWARIALPVGLALVLLLAVAASGAIGDDGDPAADDGTTTTILDPVRVRSAALLAVREANLPSLTTSTFVELIPLACEAAREDDLDELVEEIEALELDDAALERLLVGLERGVEEYCPADLRENPDLMEDLYAALGLVRSGSTTVVSSTSSSSSTTSSSTTTTRPTTTTTRRTTTTAPTTTASTTTTAPTTTTTPASSSTTTVDLDL